MSTRNLGRRRRALVAIASLLSVGLVSLGLSLIVASAASAKSAPVTDVKVWVCKYDNKPGAHPKWKGGKNPIAVSSNSIGLSPLPTSFPVWWGDAQGSITHPSNLGSIVLGYSKNAPAGQVVISAAEALQSAKTHCVQVGDPIVPSPSPSIVVDPISPSPSASSSPSPHHGSLPPNGAPRPSGLSSVAVLAPTVVAGGLETLPGDNQGMRAWGVGLAGVGVAFGAGAAGALRRRPSAG